MEKEKPSRKSREDRETTDHKHRHHHHHRSSKHHHREEEYDDDTDHRRSRRERSLDDDRHHHHHRRRHRDEESDGDDDYDDGDRGSMKERGESKKRKEREDDSEEDERIFEDKRVRVRVSEGKKERRRFEDDDDDRREKRKVVVVDEDNDGVNGEGFDNGGSNNNGRKRDRRRFEDSDVESGSLPNDGAVESLNALSRSVSETIPLNNHTATKVSSILTTNENKGVNITGSHEVTGKSSTDGTPSTAGKSGNLTLDALAKAKKTMQKQKELAEKMKKIPLLNKGASSSNAVSSLVGSKEGSRAPSVTGFVPTPSAAAGVMAASTFPAGAVVSGKLASMMDPAKYEAVKRAQELAAKMGFRQDAEFATLLNFFPGQAPPDVAALQKPAKAPVLRLDALGREIDEHGNVVNLSKPSNLSTLKVNINKQKKDAFQIYKPELEVDPEKNPYFDPRMGIDKNKLLRPKRMTFQFVEEGKWSKDAEILKLKSQFGEAQAKELKAKQAQLAKAKAEPNINPNLIEVAERVITKEKQKELIPEVEWWDLPLLRSGDYADINSDGAFEDKVKMEKITIYVEHPRPIEPPAEAAPPKPQPLKLTKKEQKKLRTQRRLAKEKDRQEMIRQGLLEPPKPKVKMSNLMKVLGSEATQDPTKLEMEIRAAAAEREQAHVDRNIARKLTPSERREKKERKLFEDPNTLETIVSIYKINDLSHPQNRFKVDINAQENRLTGCAVISDDFSVVVVEGGTKSIKRYGKLMLRRINWAAKMENEDDEEDDDEEKPANRCVLVWQGSVAKPSFSRFSVYDKRTEVAARKIFSDNGVGHYWDLAANFVDDQI